MVNYNGKEFEAISPAIRIIDVELGAPGVDMTTISPALRHGNIFARRTYGTRKVVITFVVMDDDMDARRGILHRIAAWCASDEPKKLQIPQEKHAYLNAVCTQLPDASGREFWEKLTMTFTCNDPFFYSENEKKQALTNGCTVYVTEADAPEWRIEQQVGGAISYPMWSVEDEQISFSVLSAGLLVLDRGKQTATINTNTTMGTMMLGSRFFDLKSGKNVISLKNGAAGTMYWRERWL